MVEFRYPQFETVHITDLHNNDQVVKEFPKTKEKIYIFFYLAYNRLFKTHQ